MSLLTSMTTSTFTTTHWSQRGLNINGIVSAFTHPHARNWHPLTTISHMLDCQLYGLNAGGHHFTSVALHTIAVLLLFRVLQVTTGALWPSAFVAALFAIHPLHVESVAWVSERKDVLSAVFFMLALAAPNYAEGHGAFRVVGIQVQAATKFFLGLTPIPVIAVQDPGERRVPFSQRIVERQGLSCRGLRLRHAFLAEDLLSRTADRYPQALNRLPHRWDLSRSPA